MRACTWSFHSFQTKKKKNAHTHREEKLTKYRYEFLLERVDYCLDRVFQRTQCSWCSRSVCFRMFRSFSEKNFRFVDAWLPPWFCKDTHSVLLTDDGSGNLLFDVEAAPGTTLNHQVSRKIFFAEQNKELRLPTNYCEFLQPEDWSKIFNVGNFESPSFLHWTIQNQEMVLCDYTKKEATVVSLKGCMKQIVVFPKEIRTRWNLHCLPHFFIWNWSSDDEVSLVMDRERQEVYGLEHKFKNCLLSSFCEDNLQIYCVCEGKNG